MTGTNEKKFVIKHVFEYPKVMHDNDLIGPEEYHFGCNWKISMNYTSIDHLFDFFIEASPVSDVSPIEAEVVMKIPDKTDTPAVIFIADETGYKGHIRCIDAGSTRPFLANEIFPVEYHVKIIKFNGMDKEKLRSFDESTKEFSDVVLVVEDEKFYVSKLFLASHSTYFEALLLGNFDESKQSEVELKDIDPFDFQNFLVLINGESFVEDSTVEGLLKLADFFDAKTVFRRCEEFLTNTSKAPLKFKLQSLLLDQMANTFEFKHVFTNVFHQIVVTAYSSEPKSHLSIPWRLTSQWKVGLINHIFLERLSNGQDDSVPIEVTIQSSSFSITNEQQTVILTFPHSNSTCQIASIEITDLQEITNIQEITDLQEIPRNGHDCGHFFVKIQVKIKKIGDKMTKLRSFDESNQKFSDVVLVVGDEKFYVSKLFLASHCTYFKSLFLGNFGESQESKIELKDIDPTDFQNFLELINGETLLEDRIIDGILNLADFFNSKTAMRRCEEYLIEKSQKPTGEKLRLALRFELMSLMKKCVSEIKTIRDIRSVVPEVSKQVDDSIWKMLLEKCLALQ